MVDDVSIVLGIRGDDSGGRVIKKSLDDIATSGDKATASAQRLQNSQQRLEAQTMRAANALRSAQIQTERVELAQKRLEEQQRRLNEQFEKSQKSADTLIKTLQGVAGGYVVREVVRMADQYTMLEGRIKLATRSTAEFTAAFAGLKTVSNQTGASLSDAVDVFQRLSFVRDEIDATVGQMVQFTGTVQKMGVMSGASTTAMSAGLLQLGQALSAGVVRAEEFNSVVENTPVIAKAIADQFGVTTGQLRQLVLKGLVDSADVFNAVLNEAASVEQKYAEMPVTIGRALSQLQNQLMEFIGVNAQASGASMAVVGVLDTLRLAVFGVGKAFDLIANGIGIVSQRILTIIQSLANGAISVVNFVTEQANRIPGVNTPLVGKVNFAADWSEVSAASAAADAEFFAGKKPTTIFDKMLGGESDAAASAPIKAMSKNYADLASKISNTTKLTKEQREAIKLKKKEAADALREEKKLQDTLKDAVKDSRSETEKLYDKISEMEKLRPFAKTAEQATAISKNIKNAQDELEKLRVKAELEGPTAKAFASLASEIDDGFKDAFKSAFTESDGGFKKLINGWKNTFKSFLADLAYQALARPVVVSVVGSIGGAMGLSSAAVASVLGQTTGAPGIAGGGTGGGSLLSKGSTIFSAGKALLLGGIGTGLGNFSAGLASKAYGLFSADAYGALAFGDKVGDFMANAGSLSNIGGGIAGGTLASVLGLSNKNGYVNAAASTAGALAGQALIPIPFLGAAIGSFAGSALGGLFGNKQPSDKSQWGSIDFATLARTSGGLGGKKFSAQNAGARDTILNQISGVLGLVGQYGGSATGSAAITIGNRDGLRYNGRNFGQNATAFSTAIFGDLRNSITGFDKTFTTILDKLGVGASLDTLTGAFQFGQSYNETLRTSDTMKVLADSIKVLDDNMAAAIGTATKLGLPIEEYTKALQKQKDAAVGALKAQAAGFSSLSDMTRAFDSFFNGQALGSSSSLTPMQKLQTAQSTFGDLLTKAQGGDLSVTPDLLSAASTLIDQGRNVYASGTDFSNLEGFVRSSVQGVAKSAGYSGQNVAYSIVSTNQQLVTQGADQTQAIQDMKAEIFRLSNKISVLTDKVA